MLRSVDSAPGTCASRSVRPSSSTWQELELAGWEDGRASRKGSACKSMVTCRKLKSCSDERPPVEPIRA